jgi:DNA-directed RNA polymerase subunit RPC12/RpoP
MAISVQCACGKRTAVSDALAGKAIRCPACGDAVVVMAAAPAPGRAGAKGQQPGARRQQAGPAIELSSGQKIGL